MVEKVLHLEKFNFENKVPGEDEVLELLAEWGLAGNIIDHSKVVRDVAVQIMEKIESSDVEPKPGYDPEVVEIGALVHDVGRVWTHGIEHGYVGGTELESTNIDPRIASCAKVHVLGGFTLKEIKEVFPQELKDKITTPLIPKSIEEKIVCLADKHVIGTTKVSLERRFSKWFRKYGRTQFLLLAQYRVLQIEKELASHV